MNTIMSTAPEGWKIISKRFEEETLFCNCVGALHGRHMTLQNPFRAGSTFYNYKGAFSIILMALCDSNYCFTYANIGVQRRISDRGVFNNCSLATKLNTELINLPFTARRNAVPYVIIADNAVALKPNLMVPYPGHATLQINTPDWIFNYRMSSAKSRI